MIQYCRYCCDANLTECEDIFWCSMHEKEYPVSKAKRTNKCKDFQFNSYDLFSCDEDGNFREYQPRGNYKKRDAQNDFEQIEIEG